MSAVPFAIAGPVITAIFFYRFITVYGRVLLWFLLFSGATQFCITYLAESYQNNMPFFHAYTLVECLFLIAFFRNLFPGAVMKRNLLLLAAAFILFAVANSVFFQNIWQFNSYSRSVEALIVISLCLLYFHRQFASDHFSSRDPGFWFVTGLLIYFSSSLTIFIISNLTVSLDRYLNWVIWNIHATMVLVMYIIFTIGFRKCKT